MTDKHSNRIPKDKSGKPAGLPPGIQFIPFPGGIQFGPMPFMLMPSEGEQVVKTPFGVIKISVSMDQSLANLSGEIGKIFTEGLSEENLENLMKIIEAHPEAKSMVEQIPDLKGFLGEAMTALKAAARQAADASGSHQQAAATPMKQARTLFTPADLSFRTLLNRRSLN